MANAEGGELFVFIPRDQAIDGAAAFVLPHFEPNLMERLLGKVGKSAY